MWRCLVFVVTVTFWNISVLAVPQGDNTCQGVVKHPVKIKVNVTEQVTFRSYTWCLRVPPRCSHYVVQMRERVKEQIEMHNRTITVCCRGYVEIESKCVPACPPLTDCPYMHCNRTNHCYCTPGYTGTFCNDPCSKGFWGTDCKKPCDCPDGFTCHHLTGDCMLDDKPSAKTTVRRAFTHVSSESVTTERPSTSTPKRTTRSPAPPITTLPTTSVTTIRTILTTTTFKPSQTTEQELSTTPSTTVSLKHNPPKSSVSPPPYFQTETEPTDSRDKINILKSNIMNKDLSTETATVTSTKIPALIDSVPDANPPTRMPVYSKPSIKEIFYEKSITTTTSKSFPSPEYVTAPHYEDNQEIMPSPIADKPLFNDNQKHPSSTVLLSPMPDILKKMEERKGSEESKGVRFDTNPKLTFLNNLPSTPSFQLETVDGSEDIVSHLPQPTKSGSHNFKPLAPAVQPSTFPTHLQQITSPKSQFKHQEFAVPSSTTVQSTMSPRTTSEPILPERSPEPTTSFGGMDNRGDFTFRPSSFYDSTTRPAYIPMIPMRTPNRNWNPFIPAPVPTQSHGSLTFPFTITGYNNINTNKPDTFPEIFTDKPIGQFNIEPDKFAPTLLTRPPVVQTSSSYNLKPYFIPPFDHFGVPTKSPGRIFSNSMLPSDQFINSNFFKKPSTSASAQETVVTYSPEHTVDDVVTQKEDKAKVKSISVNTTPFSINPTDKSNRPKDYVSSAYENDKNYLLSKSVSVPPANYPSFEISSPSQSHQKTELSSLLYVTKPLDILTLPVYLNIPTDKPKEITTRKLDYQNVSVPFLGAPEEIYRSDTTVKTLGGPSVTRVETREDDTKQTVEKIDESSEEETAVKPTIFESVQIFNKNNYISLLNQKTDKTTDTITVTVPNVEETNDALGTTNIIRLSTYSFLNKTVPPSIPYEMNTKVSKNITNYAFNIGVKTNHSFARNSDIVPSLPITTPLPPFTEEIHKIVNGKLLEEPSNYLPTILDRASIIKKELVLRNKSQYSTEAPQAGYLPTDKDFLNLTYILNSITDFTSNSKRAMKQSPKSGLYSNSINAKLTENPFFNLVTNSVYDKHPSTEIINPVTAFPSQKHSKHGYKLSSLHNKVASSFNDSKIIVLNVSSHLSFQNPLSRGDGKPFAPEVNQQVSSLLNPSFDSRQKAVTRSIDGRVTTVSIVSTVPFTKSPTKRSAKETTDSHKTEYAFTLNYGPEFARGRQDLDTPKNDGDTTAAYDSIKFTLQDEFDSKLLSTVSNEGSLSMTDEVSKKPFRRKEVSVLDEEGAEVRPNMTAALAAQSAEPDSNISLTTGILATVTCAILLASISSVFILIFIYCKKREKPIPMESCIMAYESTESNDPAVIYSVPRPSLLLPDVFFCPTFTNHYAAQINKELRELSYDDSSKKENSEPVYAEITTELQLPTCS